MLVIVHGWSDTSRSFRRLGETLVARGVVGTVAHVQLGDYISMDDAITFDDLAAAMDAAWGQKGLPRTPRSVDVLVHSTGSLVVRHWMTRFATAESNPIRRFVMLAPANFGSPIAHKGRSFIGRVVKGFSGDKLFQTGAQILRGLELASPFTWELALVDRLGEGEDHRWYGPGRILGSVIVGTSGYQGISAAANENGSDGTVRPSTADLNPALIEIDYATNPSAPTHRSRLSNGRVAFVRAPAENHSTVALKDKGPREEATFDRIAEALRVTDATFDAHCDSFAALSETARVHAIAARNRFADPYQNTVVRVRDSFGESVRDYFLEVFMERPSGTSADPAATREIQEKVIETVHTYDALPSYRSLLFNLNELDLVIAKQPRPLCIALTAFPEISKTKTVGYRTVGYNDIGSVEIKPADIAEFFQPDRTVLVEIVILREQEPRVFSIQAL